MSYSINHQPNWKDRGVHFCPLIHQLPSSASVLSPYQYYALSGRWHTNMENGQRFPDLLVLAFLRALFSSSSKRIFELEHRFRMRASEKEIIDIAKLWSGALKSYNVITIQIWGHCHNSGAWIIFWTMPYLNAIYLTAFVMIKGNSIDFELLSPKLLISFQEQQKTSLKQQYQYVDCPISMIKV